VLCKWENRQRAAGKRDHLLDGLSAEDEARLGSRHPRFMLQCETFAVSAADPAA